MLSRNATFKLNNYFLALFLKQMTLSVKLLWLSIPSLAVTVSVPLRFPSMTCSELHIDLLTWLTPCDAIQH